MAYPPEITTRAITVGGASGLESGDPLSITVTVRTVLPGGAGDALVWEATGWQYPPTGVTASGDAGTEVTVHLPVTDLPGWRSRKLGALIDVSAPGSYSHRYIATIDVLQNGRPIDRHVTPPFVLPVGDLSVVDLDKMVEASTVAGGTVSIPDSWSARLDALEAGGVDPAVIDAAVEDYLAENPPAAVPAASETVSGTVELATTAEATAGTDTVRAVTPAGLKAHTDALPTGGVSSWDDLTDKPATFPPTAHTHTLADVTDYAAPDLSGYATDTELADGLATKANTAHTHGAADLSGVVKTVNNTAPDVAGNVTVTVGEGGTSDHGALTGLADDDHLHYHTDARGDARYSQLGHTHVVADLTDYTPGGSSGGSSLVQVGTLTLPASPAVGESVTVLADSTTTLPATVTWDSGGAPTVTDRLLVSFVWSGEDWVGTYGPSIPAYVAPPIEVTAAGPTWTDDTDNGGGSWTTPTEAGVIYSPASGTADPDETVTVTATADTGYTLLGTTSWQHAFPPAPIPEDTTDPTPGTLTASAHTSSGFTLTATGASDAGSGLHAQPYRFSTDNGATWTAWQASASYVATGLSAETAYTCVHQVRDAAGNTAQGAAIQATTTAASAGPLAIAYAGHVDDITGKTTYTLASTPLGTASADRSTVLVVFARATASQTVTSVTIDGVAATIDAQQTVATGSTYSTIAFVRLATPSGATGLVVATFNGAVANCRVSSYALTGNTPTVADTAYDYNASAGSVSLTLDAVADGVALGMAVSGGAEATLTWTGLTEDAERVAGGGYAGAASTTTTAGALAAAVSGVATSAGAIAYGPPA